MDPSKERLEHLLHNTVENTVEHEAPKAYTAGSIKVVDLMNIVAQVNAVGKEWGKGQQHAGGD